jgi:hypothetical protein
MGSLIVILVVFAALLVIASGVWVAAVLAAVTSRRRGIFRPKSETPPDTPAAPE